MFACSIIPSNGACSITPSNGACSITPSNGACSITPSNGACSITPSNGACNNNLKKNTFMFKTLFRKLSVCEIIWKNTVEQGSPQMAIWHRRISVGYLRLQTHTQNTHYILLFYCSNGC